MSIDGRVQNVMIVTGANLTEGAPGGVRSYVVGLSHYLVNAGVAVVLVTNGHPEGTPSSCENHRVTESPVPSSLAFQRALKAWAKKRSAIAADVVHFQRPDDFLCLEGRGVLPPAVCTLHGDSLRGVRRRHGGLMARAYARREARSVANFKALIAVDPQTASTYRLRYPHLDHRIHVIPVAVQYESPKEDRPASVISEHEAPMLLYAGRLSEEKRVDLIIKAFVKLRNPEASLLIAGSGPMEGKLRFLARGSRVSFLGNVPHLELMEIYKMANALVLASEFEGMPTTALEALSSGCPVIAPTGCGLDDLLDGANGILVTDVRQLGEAMERGVRLRQQGGPINVPPMYSWKEVGRQLLATYAIAKREGTQ